MMSTLVLVMLVLFTSLIFLKYILNAKVIYTDMPISGKEDYGSDLEDSEVLQGDNELRKIRQYKFYGNRSCTKVRK